MEEKRFVFLFVFLPECMCVCVSLCLSSPSPHPHLSATDTTPHLHPSPSQYELTFFISLLLYSCCDVGQGWVGEQLKIRQDRTACMSVRVLVYVNSFLFCVLVCVWERDG